METTTLIEASAEVIPIVNSKKGHATGAHYSTAQSSQRFRLDLQLRSALDEQPMGPSPVDRGRPGFKHHLICDAGGIPLA